MSIDRADSRLIFRMIDGSDSDDIKGHSFVEDEECRDHWWSVDPERGLIFWRTWGPASPQANPNRKVADIVTPRLYPWAEIVQLPMVRYRAHDDGRVSVAVVTTARPRTDGYEGCYACMVGVWTGPESHAPGCVDAVRKPLEVSR